MSTCPHCGSRAGRDLVLDEVVDRDHRNQLMLTTLQVAVPMWMAVLADLDEADRERHIWWWTRTAADQIAEKGDILQYGHNRGGGSKPRKLRRDEVGEVGQVFNYLASGLAAAAYVPGGVCFAGLHWCVPTTAEHTAEGRRAS